MENTQECYVAFLDIMGFGDFIKKYPSEYVRTYLSELISCANSLILIN